MLVVLESMRMNIKVKTRIAPSPTGENLHIGNAYTALINWIFAKKNQGQFLIRIEDTDRTRLVSGAEKRILESLKWLNITHDEGPDKGGPYGPYRQSERLTVYKKYAVDLIKKGHAYYCFCAPVRLEKMRQEQQTKHVPPMYDGLCKKIAPKDAEKKIAAGEKYVVRLNVPDSGITKFNDLIRGEISFENKLIDDQVLLKSDGFPTYHLAVVVDDYLMKISHVIRGEEWISSTPKHILLYDFFGWQKPVYAHTPLLRNPDKSKLSKRKNPVWVSWYRENGFLPSAILNYFGTLSWSMPDGRDIFGVQDLIKHFSLENIKTTAPIFDIEKLKWMNGQYIKMLNNEQLVKQLTEFTPKVDKELITKLAPLARERMKTLTEFVHYAKPFIKFMPITLSKEQKNMLHKFDDKLNKLENWQILFLHKNCEQIVKENDFKIKNAFMSLRLAVTGEKIGLPLFETLEILGKKETLNRIKQTLSAHDSN
ncbi:MAG: Glutamate-tRNA ligase [Candidatus Gottesmanbacteria bacterium GW2011_GWA1_34_13]|uniref:Glutamate--tRNA ligase n=1 Tax=Candidatus Gottesmanbacteria bacterium GW2011_GWA1_34_13 TaxID=1618434 RepID=A0A0G0ALG1_9BACT|nr:MAG: Glutamate-tRNA ligase [Candidatus Gottesmanbacteria bacterium GW2011_GWA1_34_13]